MALAARTKSVSNAVSITYDEGTALGSTYGHLVRVRRRTFTTTPTTPSGWTLITSDTSSTTAGQWIFARRGNGSVNSFTTDGTSTETYIDMLAIAGVYDDDWIAGASSHITTAGSGVVSLASGSLSTTEDDQYAYAFCALSSTAGGSGVSWSNSYTVLGASGSASSGFAEKSVASASTSVATTATWTTGSRYAVVSVVALRVTNPVTGPNPVSITPTSGVLAGGTATTITGTGFTGTTGVTFGGSAGTSLTVVSDTSITVTTPSHAAGAVNVVVTAPSGSGTLTSGFTYAASTNTRAFHANGLTPGATLTTSSAGSGDNAFEDVQDTGAFPVIYDGGIQVNYVSAITYAEWTGLDLGSLGVRFRFTLLSGAVVDGATNIFNLFDASTRVCALTINSSRQVTLRDNANSTLGSTSSALTIGQEYEFTLNKAAGNTTVTAHGYVGASGTSFWTASGTPGNSSNVTRMRLGRQSSTKFGPAAYTHIVVNPTNAEPARWADPNATHFYQWLSGVRVPIYLIGRYSS